MPKMYSNEQSWFHPSKMPSPQGNYMKPACIENWVRVSTTQFTLRFSEEVVAFPELSFIPETLRHECLHAFDCLQKCCSIEGLKKQNNSLNLVLMADQIWRGWTSGHKRRQIMYFNMTLKLMFQKFKSALCVIESFNQFATSQKEFDFFE
jgi:hypothetical protein